MRLVSGGHPTLSRRWLSANQLQDEIQLSRVNTNVNIFTCGTTTHRLSVIHTLQQELVQLGGLSYSNPKHIANPGEKVVSDVRVQLPVTYKRVISFH